MTHPPVHVNDSFMDTIGPQQAWFAGMMASDGCLQKERYVSLSQSGDHGADMMRYIAQFLDYDGKIRTTKTARLDAHRIWFNSRKIGAALSRLGLQSPKSTTLLFPEEMKGDMSREFLRGYVEGDGSVGVYCKKAPMLCINVVGTDSFISEARELFPVPSLRTVLKARNCHELRWNGWKAEELASWLWSTPSLYEGRKLGIVRKYLAEVYPDSKRFALIKRNVTWMLSIEMSITHAAIAAGCSFQNIYKWLNSGVIPCSGQVRWIHMVNLDLVQHTLGDE